MSAQFNKKVITYSLVAATGLAFITPIRALSHCIALPKKLYKRNPHIEMYIILPLNLKPLRLLSLVGKPQIIGNLAYLNGSRLDGDHFGVILLLEKWQEHRTFTEVHSLKELFQKNLSISNFLYFSPNSSWTNCSKLFYTFRCQQ